MYDIIFYTNPYDIELVDDGERSINKEFRNNMITTFEHVLSRYDDLLKDKLVKLNGTVEERMEAIKIRISQHNTQ